MRFSGSEVDAFHRVRKIYYPSLRIGQAFHNWFKLYRITNEENKVICDKLWEMDGSEALNMIQSLTDYNQ